MNLLNSGGQSSSILNESELPAIVCRLHQTMLTNDATSSFQQNDVATAGGIYKAKLQRSAIFLSSVLCEWPFATLSVGGLKSSMQVMRLKVSFVPGIIQQYCGIGRDFRVGK